MFKRGCWIFLVGYVCFWVASAQETSEPEYPTLNKTWAYCFEYTWFGPEYNKITRYNGTCDDYRDETRAGDDIPCAPPLVISDNGTIPYVKYLWDEHKASVLCQRSDSQHCVTYTYSYKGSILNQTHMCARIKTPSSSVPTSCYTQKVDGFEIELCICKSPIGLDDMPCNSGAGTAHLTMAAILFALLHTLFVRLIQH